MSEASNVHPYVLAALLCDNIITDSQTGKKTLVGLFDNVFAQTFPAAHQLGIYLKIVDAEGSYLFRLDYVHIGGDQVLERREIGELMVRDRLQPGEVVVNIVVPIPREGSYEFRFYANGFFLTRVAFRAAAIAEQGGQEG